MNSHRIVAALMLAASVAGAQAPAVRQAAAASAQATTPKIDKSVLPNGLRLQLLEDHSSQVVSVSLWFDVGARDEIKGKTGFAHLFEHMMFQGSANIKKAEHGQLIERAGGNLNANTQYDITRYYEVVPSNRLNLALWLEAERVRSLTVNAENLKNQIEAVKEERRLRVDNQPYGKAIWETSLGLLNAADCFAYAHSIIGSMDDLNSSSVADVKAFFDKYYAPNNAVLTIAGDFDPAEAKRLVAQYFGDLKRQPDLPKPTCNQKFNVGQQTARVTDDKATLPAVLTLYRVPETGSADTPALELLNTILGAGESSRFNRVLARDTKLALGAQTMLNPFGPRRGTGIWITLAIANQGVNPDSLTKRIEAEIARISGEGVTEEELTKAKNQYRAQKVNERQQQFSMTEAVQHATFYLGGAEAVFTDLDNYTKVTVADIKRVAAKYLTPANSMLVTVVPDPSKQRPTP